MAAQDRKFTKAIPEFDIIRSTRDTEASELHITVGKGTGGITLTAGVVGLHEGFITTVLFGDFYQTEIVKATKRVTQKQVDAAYDEFVTDVKINQLIDNAVMFYADLMNKKMTRDGYEMTPEQLEFFNSRAKKVA